MDDAELHLRLSACRPNGQDADDPWMREALEALPRHPRLAEWHRQQTDFDRAVCRHLEQAPIPSGLRVEILAAEKLCHAGRSRRVWLPWAAAAALLATAAVVLWLPPATAPASLAQAEVELVEMFDRMRTEGMSLDHVTDQLAEVNTWLADAGAPLPYLMQAGLRDARPTGCRVLEWRGRKVTMICFRKGESVAHLFVLERDALAPETAAPSREPGPVQQVAGHPVAAWGCRKCQYVLVGAHKGMRLEDFF